jgi:hypothetical protein
MLLNYTMMQVNKTLNTDSVGATCTVYAKCAFFGVMVR